MGYHRWGGALCDPGRRNLVISRRERYWQWRRRTANKRPPPLLWLAKFCRPNSRFYWQFVWPLQSTAVRVEHVREWGWLLIRIEAVAFQWLFWPEFWRSYQELARNSVVAWCAWKLGLRGPVSRLTWHEWLWDRALLAPAGSNLKDQVRWLRVAHEARRRVRRARVRYYRPMYASIGGFNPPPFPNQFTGFVFDAGGEMINVKNPAYGLQGDGVSNDGTLLAAMILNLSVNGAWVFFPQGTYMIDVSVHPQAPGPVRYSGAGMGISILMPTAANIAQIFIATSNVTKTFDLEIENLTFDGNVANRASGNVLVQLRGINARFNRVRFQNATDWNTKVFQATSIGSIDTTNHRSSGIMVFDGQMFSSGDGWTLNGLDHVMAMFNWGYGNGHNHIDVNSCHSGIVENNLSEYCGGLASLSAEGCGILLFSTAANGGLRDIAVGGNTNRSNGQAQYGATTGTSRDGIRFSDDGATPMTGVVIGHGRSYDDFGTFSDTLKATITTAPASGTVETWQIPTLPYLWPFSGTFSIQMGTETMRVITGQNAIGSSGWGVIRGDNGTVPITHLVVGAAFSGVQMQAYGVRGNVSAPGCDVMVKDVNVKSGGRIGNALVVTGLGAVTFRDCPGLNPTGSAVITPAVATPTTFTTGVDVQLTYIANAVGTTMTVDGKAMSPTPANQQGSILVRNGSTVSYNNAPLSWAASGI